MTTLRDALSPPLPERGANCPPTFALEAFAAGEENHPAIQSHIPACSKCQPYVQSLRAKLDEFQRQRPTAVFLRQLEQRKNRQHFSRRWFPVIAVAFSTVALVVVAPILWKSAQESRRIKGSPFSVFYKRTGMKAAEKVTPDLPLRAGDALRFSYLAPSDGHIAILDLDTTGRVSVVYPFGGDRPAPIQGGSTTLLPNSVILDKSPGYEWLICVFSARPFELAPIVQQLKSHLPGAPIEVNCPGCAVDSIRVQRPPLDTTGTKDP